MAGHDMAACWLLPPAQPPSFNKASQRPAFFDIRESETWATLIYTSCLRVSIHDLIFWLIAAFRIEPNNFKRIFTQKKTECETKKWRTNKKTVTSPNFQSSPLEPWKPMGETYAANLPAVGWLSWNQAAYSSSPRSSWMMISRFWISWSNQENTQKLW